MLEASSDTFANQSATEPGKKREATPRAIATLGMRLMHDARQIAASKMPTFAWLRSFDLMMERLTSLSVPSERCFQRTEASHIAPFSHSVMSQPSPAEIPLFGGLPLSPHVQQGLQSYLGPGTEDIRVHDDEFADTIARTRQADAVTVGHHMFFRQGRLRPQEDEGFALLAHETTHILQALRPNTAWRRATQGGVQEEERKALFQEQRVLGAKRSAHQSSAQLAAPPTQSSIELSRSAVSPAQLHTTPGPTSSSPGALRPMAASTDRNLDSGSDALSPAPALPNFEDLRRSLYRDLMSQIKADLERGG